MILTKELSIELVDHVTNEVVASRSEIDVMWYARSNGYYLDSLSVIEGSALEVGTYDLKVYYGEERLMIFEKSLTLVE